MSIQNGSESSLLSSLLPSAQMQEIATKEGFYMIKNLLNLAKDAVYSLQKGELSKFDAHVSDQSCQNRAIIVSLIAQKVLEQSSCLNELAQTLQHKIVSVQDKLNKLNQAAKGLTLSLDKEIDSGKFDITVPDSIAYMIKCFLLHKAKAVHTTKSDCSCHKERITKFYERTEIGALLKATPPKSASLLTEKIKAIIEKTKSEIAETSCHEIIHCMKKIPSFEGAGVELVQLLQMSNEKIVMPCFLSMQAVLHISGANSIPILLKMKQASHRDENFQDPFNSAILYKIQNGLSDLSGESIEAVPVEESHVAMDVPVLVIEGQRFQNVPEPKEEHLSRLLKSNFIDLCLMNAAQHAQYSDSSLDETLLQAPLLQEKIQKIALEAHVKGCSFENQSLMRINHIYCSTLKYEKSSVELIKQQNAQGISL